MLEIPSCILTVSTSPPFVNDADSERRGTGFAKIASWNFEDKMLGGLGNT